MDEIEENMAAAQGILNGCTLGLVLWVVIGALVLIVTVAVLRKKLIDARTLRLFAVWCAREALALVDDPDPRSIAACDVAERYANGEASPDDLAAAWSAAAAWDAARAAADATWDAEAAEAPF